MQAVQTVADVIVHSLIQHGIDTVFAMPGDQLTPLFHALYKQRHQIRVIHPRHEQGAAYMAFGYARATGKPGILIVPPGPGLLNALAGMAVGYATSTPMLCITGQVPSGVIGMNRGVLHELPDQLGILRTLTQWANRLLYPTDTESIFAQAFKKLTEGRARPVALEVPSDILSAMVPTPTITKEQCIPTSTIDATSSEYQVAQAAALLRKAQRPLIVVGGGAIKAAESLAALSELLQAPIAANGGGRGIVSERSYLSLTWPAAHELWKNADVILAVGTRLSQPRFQWGLDDHIRIIRIDIDATELTNLRKGDLGIHGDALHMVDTIRLLCAGHEARSRKEELHTLKSKFQKEFAKISPQHEFVSAIRKALPDDAIIVDELTQIGYACRYELPVYQVSTYITSGYQGALGYGFPTALGAKVGMPDRTVLSINGDGGFMYAASELATAVQQKLGIIIVVFNDGQFGNIAREQGTADYSIATDLHNPDLMAFSKSFGAHAVSITSPSELTREIREASGRSVPTVIEVCVGNMPSPWHLIRLPAVRGTLVEKKS